MFPLVSLTLYLPWAKRVRFVHAPLQILSIILLIIGLSTGVILAKKVDQLDGYHQVIGYIIVTCLVVFQPALGIYQHLYYHRNRGRSALGAVHQWLGRTVILAGVVNGGLGFMQSGPVGSTYVPHGAVAGYSIVAVVVFLFYLAVVVISKRRAQNAPIREKPYDQGYEMHPSSRDNAMSPTNPNYQSRHYPNQRQPPQYR
jgi:Ca2+/Na+ antiporter